MKINGKEILERLAALKKNDREQVTLYLSKSLYSAFKERCDDIPASQVLEELLKAFIESTPESSSKKRK